MHRRDAELDRLAALAAIADPAATAAAAACVLIVVAPQLAPLWIGLPILAGTARLTWRLAEGERRPVVLPLLAVAFIRRIIRRTIEYDAVSTSIEKVETGASRTILNEFSAKLVNLSRPTS